jgi:hypothetical protein
MSELIELPLSTGGTVLVQVDGTGTGDAGEVVTRGWREQRQDQAPQRLTETFEQAVSNVRPAADALLANLTGLAHAPDEVSVEFAIQLSAQTGTAFIAALGSTANFKVNLTWRRTPPPPSG